LCTPSLHAGTWHTPPVHTRLVQSDGAPQVFPSAHAPQLDPPQSIAVSEPFLTPSVHVAAWQILP
jgi:hypothetical protein